MRIYTAAKAVIEALSVTEGFVAFASDTDEFGFYDGASWTWSAFGGAIGDHDHTGDVGDGGQLDHGDALTGRGDDDHTLYLLADGTRELAGDWGVGETYGISEIPFLDFFLTYADGHQEGRMHWNAEDGTLEIGLPGGNVNLQIGQEHLVRCRNETGVEISNGKVVYITGASGNKPLIALSKADAKATAIVFGVATEAIAHNDNGYVNVGGLVRDMDTSAIAAGGYAFMSAATAGELAASPPDAPNYKARVGYCLVQHGSEGVLLCAPSVVVPMMSLSDVKIDTPDDTEFLRWVAGNSRWELADDSSIDHTAIANIGSLYTHAQIEAFLAHFNGSFMETFDALVTEDGGTVTMSLEQAGGGDLTMRFSTGLSTLDCTDPVQTIELTVGSDPSPQVNFIYVLESTGLLTKATDAWPSAEHIKVGFFLVPSAAYVAASGCYINQNWNDHATDVNDQGHMLHMAERSRRLGAIWFSGVAGDGTSDYLTLAGTTVDLKTTAGVIYQMHKHTFPAFNTSGGDIVLVKNWFGDAYHDITNLYDIAADSTDSPIGLTKYFNLVIWGVANKSGEPEQLVINLPNGFYNTLTGALTDADGHDDFTIPREFSIDSSTGFLICRLTVRKVTDAWTHHGTVDLRGTTPQTATGTGTGAVTEFPDNVFRVYDESDDTKEVALSVGGLTAATVRTLTVQDADGTIELTGHASKHDYGGADALSDVPNHDHAGMVQGDGTQLDHGDLAGLADDDHGQYVKDSEYSAKGDILGGTGAGAFAALGVGGDGEFLVADSGEATGLNWVAGGGAIGDHDHTGDPGDGGQLDHGAALTGLADDDHTQYVLATGTRAGASSQAQSFGANGILTDHIGEATGSGGLHILHDTGIGLAAAGYKLYVYDNTTGRYAMHIRQDHTGGYGLHIDADGASAALRVTAGSMAQALRVNQTGVMVNTSTQSTNCVFDVGVASGQGIRINETWIGYSSVYGQNYLYLSHYDLRATSGGYAMLQVGGGGTFVNAASGQTLSLRTNNQDEFTITGSLNTSKNTLRCDGDMRAAGGVVAGSGTYNVGTGVVAGTNDGRFAGGVFVGSYTTDASNGSLVATADGRFGGGVYAGSYSVNPATGYVQATVATSGFFPFVTYDLLPDGFGTSGAVPFMGSIERNMSIRRWSQAVYVTGTNNVSNYWNISLRTSSGTVIYTHTTSGISAGSWNRRSTTGLSYSVTTGHITLYVRVDKQGSPGNIYMAGPALYFY